jgi:hypothetical protein
MSFRYPPPVTTVSTLAGAPAGTAPTAVVHGGAPGLTHAAPGAMADPAQASRIILQLQKQLGITTQLVVSDPHTGRVILKGLVLAANTTLNVKHRLGRAWIGALIGIPDAYARVMRIAPTTQFPAAQFFSLQADANCTIDLEVW